MKYESKQNTACLLIFCIVMGGLFFPAAAVFSQEETAEEAIENSDLTGFVPAPEGVGVDEVSAPLMVTLAYGFIWLFAAVFIWSSWRRSHHLANQLEQSKRRLDEMDEALRLLLESRNKGGS